VFFPGGLQLHKKEHQQDQFKTVGYCGIILNEPCVRCVRAQDRDPANNGPSFCGFTVLVLSVEPQFAEKNQSEYPSHCVDFRQKLLETNSIRSFRSQIPKSWIEIHQIAKFSWAKLLFLHVQAIFHGLCINNVYACVIEYHIESYFSSMFHQVSGILLSI
jgi:hypothetical protein